MSNPECQHTGETAEDMAEHLKECTSAQALIVCENGLSGDDAVNTLIDAGYTFGGVEYIGGKRIRTLKPPATPAVSA